MSRDKQFRNQIPTSSTAAPGAHVHAGTDITSALIAQARLGTGSGGTGTKFLADDQTYKTVTSGTGDVVGPASAVSGNLPSFSGTTGKLIADSGLAVSAVATLAGSQTLTNKTLTSPTLTAPVLGTPASGDLTNCTFPTLNQNTTGSAAKLTTARTINGASFDGTANITFDYRPGGTDVAITDGGTGVSTLPSGLLKGAGTSPITAATAGTDYYAPSATDVAVADGGTGASTAAGARTNLGVPYGGALPGIPYNLISKTGSAIPDVGEAYYDGSTDLQVSAIDANGNDHDAIYGVGPTNVVLQVVDGDGHIATAYVLSVSPTTGGYVLSTDYGLALSAFSAGPTSRIYLRF